MQSTGLGGRQGLDEGKGSIRTQYKYSSLSINVPSIESQFLKLDGFKIRLFDEVEWNLSDRLYRDEGMHMVFKYLLECRAKVLRLDYNKYPNILRSIGGVRFSCIKQVFLGDNTIVSVQEISRVDMGSLEILHLNDNPITNLQGFRKASFPNLVSLSLKQTKLNSQGLLYPLCLLNCPRLETIFLDYIGGNILMVKKNWIMKGNWVINWKQEEKRKCNGNGNGGNGNRNLKC